MLAIALEKIILWIIIPELAFSRTLLVITYHTLPVRRQLSVGFF